MATQQAFPPRESSSMDVSMALSTDSSVSIGGEKSMLDPSDEVKGVEAMLEALAEEEKESLTDPAMPVRHFRSEKGVLNKAIRSLKVALQWRRDFEVEKIVNAFQTDGDPAMKTILEEENAPGKMYVRGYDNDGRAFVYMKPAKETSTHELNNMRHLVFNLEKAFACTARKSLELAQDEASAPLEKICILIDYENFQLSKAPPLSTARLTLDILQKYNPERVHRYYVLNPPMVFRLFWNIVKPFVSAATKEKTIFCTGKNGLQCIWESCSKDTSQLEVNAGGDNPNLREFNSKEYLNSLPFDKAFGE